MKAPLLTSKTTLDFSLPAAINTINPASYINSSKLYVPLTLVNLFRGKLGGLWLKSAGPVKAAHILAKISGGALAFGLGAWGIRALLHSMKIDAIDNVDPSVTSGDKLLDINNRLYALTMLYTPNKKIKKAASAYDIAIGGLPPLVAVIAAMTALKKSDKYYDNKLGELLDRSILKLKKRGDLIAFNRIMNNRQMVKTLGGKLLPGGLTAALTTVLAAVFAGAAFAGFNWQRNNSPATTKYKAYKKGLLLYSKNRQLNLSVESRPLNKNLIGIFNLNTQNKPAEVTQDPMKELLV